jgi:L-ascorbate metabolism protein UlaG (beta-lactamase superfamily)
MKACYLGHACYLFEIGKVRVVVDPLLTRSLQDGTAEVWPARTIEQDAFPAIDAAIITHCHPGHLEIPSLALLPRDIPVYHPPDDTIALVLAELGFIHRQAVEPMQFVHFGDGRCVFTGSTSSYPELGCLFLEGEQSCWYLADTGVGATELDLVARTVRKVDLLIGNYPAYQHRFFTHGKLAFPDGEMARALETVAKVSPTMLVPNFTGLRYVGDGEWINRYMFPIDSRRFLDDVERLGIGVACADLNPGDSVLVGPAGPRLLSADADFVRLLDADGQRSPRFDPTDSMPPLTDPDPEAVGADALRARLREFVHEAFVPWLAYEARRPTSSIAAYARLSLRFALIAVFPDGGTTSWRFDLGDPRRAPCESAEPAGDVDMILRIAASVLDRWRRAEIPYYQAYCYARPYDRAYRTARFADGGVAVESIECRDPLSLYLSGDRERVYHPWIRREIRRHAGVMR